MTPNAAVIGSSALLEHKTKRCRECGVVKPLSEYYPHGIYWASKCKPCHNLESINWAKAHPEKARAAKKKCWKTRPKRFAEARRWRERNPEKVRLAKQVSYRKKRAKYILKAKHYQDRRKRELHPTYVRRLLVRGSAMRPDEAPQSLIRLKTRILKIKRYAKRQNLHR